MIENPEDYSATVRPEVFEDMLQEAPFGICLVNTDFSVEFYNETWQRLFSARLQENSSKNLLEIWPEAAVQLRKLAEQLNQSESKAESEILPFNSGENGETATFKIWMRPVTKDGVFLHYSLVAFNISGLQMMRYKGQQEEERLRLATESSDTAIWDLNLTTHEIDYSDSLAQIFGYSPGEIVTHEQLRSHLSEHDRVNVVDKAFERALETGIYRYEAHITDRNGVDKWIFTNGKLFNDQHGKPERMLGVLQDITERKKSELRLQQSHHQLNTAMDATNLGMFEMNPETLEKYNFSPRFLEIFEYDPENEKIDTHIFERHIHPEFRHVRVEALHTAQETGDLYYQTKIILRNGKEKWIELYGRLSPGVEGRKAYIAGTIRDITELKNYQEKLSASEKKYRFLADVMPQAVWIAEPDGRVNYFNKFMLNYTGMSFNELIDNHGWLQMVHVEDQPKNMSRWLHSVKTKEPYFFEHRLRNAQGEYRWFMSRAFPETDEAGSVTKWLGTSTDIDDMKRQEMQKDDFIKMANHELKTPVTTIKGYVQLLKKTRGDSPDKFLVNSLNTIEKQVNKLSSLIGDLLDISRIETGTLPLNMRDLSLVELVTETVEDIRASEDCHQIICNLKHSEDIEVYGDKERLTQVLNNLLTNAIKYSPRANRVFVEIFIDGNDAVVSVEDFGIGIDAAECAKIFGRFYRVSGDDEKTFPGFGIGLFIVQDILQRHEGNIWVESEKNKGSKFYFSLPVKATNF